MHLAALHVARNWTSEYDVHRLLFERVDPAAVRAHVAQQTEGGAEPHHWDGAQRVVLTHDFGRDLTLDPKPSRLRRGWMMATRFPGAVVRLVRFVREAQADAIYTCQQTYDMRLGRIVARLFSLPHIVHVSYPIGHFLGRSTVRLVRTADHVFACSEFVARTIEEVGVPHDRVVVLYHGAELGRYVVDVDRPGVRSEFGWTVDTPVIISAARLDEGKGHPLLLEAFSLVLERLPDARLLVCGENSWNDGYDDVIAERVTELDLAEHVAFVGFRSDLAQLLAASDVFVLATEDDALPLVFLAAMAAGLPCVAIDSGGVPEIVRDGENGFIAPPGDEVVLANRLIELLENPDLRAEMGARGFEFATTAFAPGTIASAWSRQVRDWLTASAT